MKTDIESLLKYYEEGRNAKLNFEADGYILQYTNIRMQEHYERDPSGYSNGGYLNWFGGKFYSTRGIAEEALTQTQINRPENLFRLKEVFFKRSVKVDEMVDNSHVTKTKIPKPSKGAKQLILDKLNKYKDKLREKTHGKLTKVATKEEVWVLGKLVKDLTMIYDKIK